MLFCNQHFEPGIGQQRSRGQSANARSYHRYIEFTAAGRAAKRRSRPMIGFTGGKAPRQCLSDQDFRTDHRNDRSEHHDRKRNGQTSLQCARDCQQQEQRAPGARHDDVNSDEQGIACLVRVLGA
jgi:hypothetical protein